MRGAFRGLARPATPVVLAATLLAAMVGVTPATAQFAPGCGWAVVPAAVPPGNLSILSGVGVVSANDVWAVGFSQNQPLAEHWDGVSWSIVPTPSTGGTFGELSTVAAIASNDVWAVGHWNSNTGAHTLAEHWDGTSWTIKTTVDPNPGGVANNLHGVAVVGPNDVWAAGYTQLTNVGASHTLIEHWNGAAWSQSTSVDPGTTENVLDDVAVASSSSVIAVGFSRGGSGRSTLVERWSGSAWTQDTTPSPGSNENVLSSAAAVPGSSQFWAVGDFNNGGLTPTQITALHFTGSWAQTNPVNPSSTNHNAFEGVAALGSQDAWAVGSYIGPTVAITLTEHWDGTGWTVVPSPTSNGVNASLSRVAYVSATELWAVGETTADQGHASPLIEHFTCPSAAQAPALPKAGWGPLPRRSPPTGLVPAVLVLALGGLGAMRLRRRMGRSRRA